MADLTTIARKHLKPEEFALPSERKFPIPDRSHAANAKARAAQSGSPDIKSKVDAAVARRYPDLGSKSKKKS